MKVRNTYNVTVRKVSFDCPKGPEVLKTLSEGGTVRKVTFIPSGKGTPQMRACAGSAVKENVFGRVESVYDNGAKTNVTPSTLEDALKIGYKVKGLKIGASKDTFELVFEEMEPDGKVTEDSSELEKVMADIVKRGVNSKQDLDAKVEQMRKNRVPETAILKVLTSPGYEEFDPDVSCPKTFYVDPDPKRMPSIMTTCLVLAVSVKRFIAEGDKSVGKNVMTEELAWLLNLKYSLKTMSRGLTYEDMFGNMRTEQPELASMSDEESTRLALAGICVDKYGMKAGEVLETLGLTGARTAGPKKAAAEDADAHKAAVVADLISKGADVELTNAARFEMLKAKAATIQLKREITDFTDWIANGGMMCLNEVNLADPNFLASFVNQLTDGTGFLEISGLGRVRLNDKAVLVGNRNKGYTGTQEANEATMSRFPVVKFDYPASIENILKSAVKHRLDGVYFQQCDTLYVKLRESVRQNLISNQALNIRGFVAALESVAQFPGVMTLNEALRVCVVYLVEQDVEQSALIQTLNDVVNL